MNAMRHPLSGNSPREGFQVLRAIGCCAGQALGGGFTFVASWAVAGVISALLAPLFGSTYGENTPVGVLLAGLTCLGSLVTGFVISFIVGRLFPLFGRK